MRRTKKGINEALRDSWPPWIFDISSKHRKCELSKPIHTIGIGSLAENSKKQNYIEKLAKKGQYLRYLQAQTLLFTHFGHDIKHKSGWTKGFEMHGPPGFLILSPKLGQEG